MPSLEKARAEPEQGCLFGFLEERGKEVNPLFTPPNLSNQTLMSDWMHACDEGTGALAAGQILKELLPSMKAAMLMKRVPPCGTTFKNWLWLKPGPVTKG